MQAVWANIPEIWTTLNSKHDVSDLGNIRKKENGKVLYRYKDGNGYACVSLYGNTRQVHGYVLRTFIPKPSPMYTLCDHINRNTMDPRLINLRWSNHVLNMMNRTGVKGYRTYKYETADGPVVRYGVTLTLLGMECAFDKYDSPEVARAVYEYWQRRAYEVIDALCSHNLHWKLQARILEYWVPFNPRKRNRMKWQRDPEYAKLPRCGRLC